MRTRQLAQSLLLGTVFMFGCTDDTPTEPIDNTPTEPIDNPAFAQRGQGQGKLKPVGAAQLGLEVVIASVIINPNLIGFANPICPDGKVAIGGGHSWLDAAGNERLGFNVIRDEPRPIDAASGLPRGWEVSGFNSANASFLNVFALCINE